MQIQHNQTLWLNLANPENKDLVFLQDELKISPAVQKELLGFNKRPKVEEYDNYLFLVLHFPVFHEGTRQTVPTELDFIVTQNRVITIYQNTNPSLEKFFDEVKNNNDLQANYFRSPAYLLFCILDRLVDSCLPMLDHIHEKIEVIEQAVFKGKEKEMLKEIAIVKRDIIDFRRTIKPQRLVLELLGKKINRFFKQAFDFIAQEVIGSEVRVWNILENHKELIEAIEKTNEGLLSFQINRVMHTLTFFSIILFSLTFIASFFSMQMVKNLLIGHPFGLWIIMGIMLADVLLITILFKRKRWM
ncbi:magnesium transporter CorA family protein [Patescibacteria group bacterium]|nr:magnesium transporter CorA family protein [Patescibacteria group bacterium]